MLIEDVMLIEPDDVADPLLVTAAPLAVFEHVAAVGRLKTPTGLQMPLAYLIVASWSALSQALKTQHVIPLMKLVLLQIHVGSRLQDCGIAATTQLCAQTGRPVKLCAETRPARRVATTMLWNFMACDDVIYFAAG